VSLRLDASNVSHESGHDINMRLEPDFVFLSTLHVHMIRIKINLCHAFCLHLALDSCLLTLSDILYMFSKSLKILLVL